VIKISGYLNIVENRTWYTHMLTDSSSVTADSEITEITTLIENADVSLINVATSFSAAGKLYYVDENGNETYLTDPNQDWPAKYTIISSFFLKKDHVVSLQYTSDATMHHLYVSHTSGVF